MGHKARALKSVMTISSVASFLALLPGQAAQHALLRRGCRGHAMTPKTRMTQHAAAPFCRRCIAFVMFIPQIRQEVCVNPRASVHTDTLSERCTAHTIA